MKKYLFLISSTALALAATLSAMAAPPLAEKSAAPAGIERHAIKKAPEMPDAKPIRQKMRTVGVPEPGRGLFRAVKGSVAQAPAHNPAREATDIPPLRGMVVYNDSFTNSNQPQGLYDITLNGNTMLIKGPGGYGGVEADGIYYVHTYGEFPWSGMYGSVSGYDLQTLQNCFSPMDTSPILGSIGGLAKDPTTGDIYAITFNNVGEGQQLTKFTYYPSYVSYSKIADVDSKTNFNSIACDKDGQLYAVVFEADGSGDSYTVTSSSLVKIDKMTGAITVVGNTGQLPHGVSGATIDPATNRMFWTVYTVDGEGYLCEVDLATGAATKIYDFPENDEITGLCIPEPLAKPKAPAKPGDFTVDFPRGSLSGTIGFKSPVCTYDGTPAEGELNYTITYGNGYKIEGTTSYGATVSEDVKISWPGNFNIEAYVYNEAGKSPKVFTSTYIGRGVPKAPVVTMAQDGSKIDLRWDAITESSDGGFIDPDSVTYTVRRYVNETPVVIADSIEGTSCTDEFADASDPTTIYYTVQSHASVKSSAEIKTRPITMGSVTPPYTNDFATPDRFGGFSVLDVKGDGKTWELYSSYSGLEVRCNYSYSNPKDDWLFTPPLNLKAGHAYRLGFSAKASYTAETIEARWGDAPTAEAMTGEIVAPTTVKGSKKVEMGSLIVPEADGQYYLGIHAMTTKSTNYLYADDIVIEEVDATLVPGTVTGLTVKPDASGALRAEISFTAPAVTLGGTPLEALDRIVVKRDGLPLDTIMAPVPGAPLFVVDTPSSAGYRLYTVQAFTANGGGKSVSASAFIGVNRPAAPTNVKMEETTTPGEVHFSWDAVTTDIDGNPLNSDFISYSICVPVDLGFGIYYQPVYENIKATEYTSQEIEPGKQTFVQYIVCAKTSGGLSQGVTTPLMAVGTPYEEVNESFAGGYASYAFYNSGNESTQWILATDVTFNGLTSQDADNGFLYMNVAYIDYYAELTTAKIRLPADNAAIQFHTYKFESVPGYPEVENTFEIFVRELGDEEYTRIGKPLVIKDLSDDYGWIPVNVSLADYNGKTVQIKIKANAVNDAMNFIDNMHIGRILARNASAGISAPARVSPGRDYSATVTVSNKGIETLDNISVRLYADGAEVASGRIADLSAGTSAPVVFTMTMHPLAERPVALVATVETDGDLDIADNTSDIASVTPKVSAFPAVTNLKGQPDGNGGVSLSWTEPDLSLSPAAASTEDFEEGESFATTYGDWIFVDVDKETIAAINGISMPVDYSQQSFWIHDRNWENGTVFNNSFNAHSGTKYLASMMTYSGARCSDWAITPALCGEAQDVSFWARSYHPSYPERMEVYYSTGSTDPADFIKIGQGCEVPDEWTRYIIELPAGAKRFAIRKCSVNGFLFFADDFEFAPENAEPDRDLIGYDVYRDAEIITDSHVAATSWIDAAPAAGAHEYAVVAVYGRGLSRAAKTSVDVAMSGLETIEAADTEAEYYNLQGIRIDNPEHGQIYLCRKNGIVTKVIIR